MGIKFLIILLISFLGCSTFRSNFNIETKIKEVRFDCSLTGNGEFGTYLKNWYIDTFINLKLWIDLMQ